MQHRRKTVVQAVLMIAGFAMICLGIFRAEWETVLSKAIRLCLECVGIG